MTRFTTLDWIWTGAFLLLVVGGAFFFYRLARRSESDFFLAGRGLLWRLPASSVFSTHTATDTPMWVTGVVYANGRRGLWYTFFAAWTAIVSFISARMFRRSLAYTQAEWQTKRYSGLGAELLRGWFAGWQVFMNMFILGWVGMAMGKVGCRRLRSDRSPDMERGLVTLLGMSIAYVASLLGMLLACWAWRRRRRDGNGPGRGRS